MNAVDQNWRRALLPITATVQQAVRNLDQVAIKIVLVESASGRLEGTVSDGDIRRGLLRGLDLGSPLSAVIHHNPLVVPPDMPRDTVMKLMVANKIQQVPVVDEHGKVVGLHLWDQLTTPQLRSNTVVVMAGGKGTRMMPHTANCPKPMLPVHGKPMLQHIIERAMSYGFTKFLIAINYLVNLIECHFRYGSSFGIHIGYIREKSSLGTAGSLSLIKDWFDEPFLVTNGDVLSDINYGALLDFHIRQQAVATMAIGSYEWQHPFGVVRTRGVEIIGFEEKPLFRSHVDAGVYALDPVALYQLEPNENCDMPLLFERLRTKGDRTVAYPMHEPWLDVGRPSDYQTAQMDRNG